MNRFSKFFLAALLAGALPSARATAGSYIALDSGYRWDKISNRVTTGGPTVAVKGSTQTMKSINSYQIGGIGELDCFRCWFVKGEGHYGTVKGGDYSESGFFGHAKGYTYDLKGAVGYECGVACGITAKPLAGWSFDALNLRGTCITTAINGVKYHLSNIKAHQQFKGPFVGLDLAFDSGCCYNFVFGYEFHIARWHGKRLIQGREYGNPPFGTTTGYSNVRNLHRAYGQLFRLDAIYQCCHCWTAGVGLKYQFYNGDFGKYKQTKVPLPSQYTYADVDGLWWSSFAATITVGRAF